MNSAYGVLSCGSSSQGNSILILKITPGRAYAQAVMFDAGCGGKRVASFISQAEAFLGLKIQVEAIIVTHMHNDHAGAVHILSDLLSPDAVFLPDMLNSVRQAHHGNWSAVSARFVDTFANIDKKGITPCLYSPELVTEFYGSGVHIEDDGGIVRHYRSGREVAYRLRGSHALLLRGESVELSPDRSEQSPGVIKLSSGAEITSCAVQHDTLCYALKLNWDGFTFAYIVDLGAWNASLVEVCRDVDSLVLEFNYDELLIESQTLDYPPAVKERIRGVYGHLSNDQSADFLAELCSGENQIQVVLAAHRGGQTNSEYLVRQAMLRGLSQLSHQRVECLARKHGSLILFRGVFEQGSYRVVGLASKLLPVP